MQNEIEKLRIENLALSKECERRQQYLNELGISLQAVICERNRAQIALKDAPYIVWQEDCDDPGFWLYVPGEPQAALVLGSKFGPIVTLALARAANKRKEIERL
jgi:hypothetical protein